MAQICRTMVAFAARASALQAWNTWIVPDTIRQSTRIHRVRAPACGRRTYLHRNRAWGIVKWPHVITATDARGEAAGPARRNSRRRSGSVPGRPRRCQIFGGGPVGRAGLLARNRGISIALVLFHNVATIFGEFWLRSLITVLRDLQHAILIEPIRSREVYLCTPTFTQCPHNTKCVIPARRMSGLFSQRSHDFWRILAS